MPRLLLISDQVMLKAGNQVLFQTVKGFLVAGFCVDLVIQRNSGHEPENLARVEDLLPDYLDRLSVSLFDGYFGSLFELGRKVQKHLKFRRVNPKLHEFPESNSVIAFEHNRTNSYWLSDLRFYSNCAGAFNMANKLATRNRPDLICGFEIGGAVPGERLAKRLGIPFVTKYMGTIVWPFLEAKTEHLVRPYIKGLSVDSDIFFMLNDGTKGDRVLKCLGITEEKLRFRIDGVNKSSTDRKLSRADFLEKFQLELPEGALLALCLSNHNGAYKRLDRAVRAAAAASAQNRFIHLILVGNGKNTPELKALVRELCCDGNVHFIPKVLNKDISVLLNSIDFYLNTNDQSNLSHPVLEAMVAGRSVISMDDGSLDGIIRDGETGTLVRPSSCQKELPAALLRLAANPGERLRLGRNARDYAVREFFSWEEKNALEANEVLELLKAWRPLEER
jgi:glycosyltransferase involved in cell wall biosynthesis